VGEILLSVVLVEFEVEFQGLSYTVLGRWPLVHFIVRIMPTLGKFATLFGAAPKKKQKFY
jgi:hypothetical protein